MKRSDISTFTVLFVFSQPFAISGWRDERIEQITGAPIKVVWAAMMREERRGYIEYGTSLRGGWLTREGEKKLKELIT